jgi:hypothetical protein
VFSIHHESLDRASCDWLQSFNVLDLKSRTWLERIQPGKLAAYSFGYGGHERARLCTDLIAWLFLFDDAYAEGTLADDTLSLRRQHQRYDALFKGDFDAGPQNPFGRSLGDLFKRLSTIAPMSWVMRLAASVRGYLDGCELETTFRARKSTPSIQAYLWFRDRSIGVYPMLDMIEFAGNSYLLAEEVTDPIVIAMRRSGNLVIALTNDLHSSNKESTEAESFNAVLVTQRQFGLARPEAMASVTDLQATLRGDFEHYARVCEPHASQGLKDLVSHIPVWIDGNQRWSSECPRYNQLEGLLEGFRPPPSAPRFGRP